LLITLKREQSEKVETTLMVLAASLAISYLHNKVVILLRKKRVSSKINKCFTLMRGPHSRLLSKVP